jgi:ribosomal protein L11 methyltransferase
VQAAAALAAVQRPGAAIALAGILSEQAEDVLAAFEADYALAVSAEREGWVLVAGTRRAG